MDNEKKPENPYAFATANEYFRQNGMTLMDYFAAQAMPALIERYMGNGNSSTECKKLVAAASYDIAKEMLKEREKH